MPLFRRKSAEKKAPQKISEVLTDEFTGQQIVLGMHWRTLVKKDGADKFLAEQRPKPTHYLTRGVQVGYCSLPDQAKEKKSAEERTIYAGASLLARSYATLSCAFLKMSGMSSHDEDEHADMNVIGKYWVCLVRNGLPTNTDEILHMTEADAIDFVRNLVNGLDGEAVTILTNVDYTGLRDTQPFDIDTLLHLFADDTNQLKRFKSGTSLPKPVLGLLGVMVLLFAVDYGYGQYKAYERRKSEAKAGGAAAIELEKGYELWRQAYRDHIANIPAGSSGSLNAINESIMRMPVLIQGWLLTGVDCNAMHAQGTTKLWSCTASYVRKETISATSKFMKEEFSKIFPSHVLTFPALHTMTSSWQVQDTFKPIDDSKLEKFTVAHLSMVSQLQKILSTLQAEPNITKVPVEVPPPKNAEGRIYQRPDDLPNLTQIKLEMKGPWRSVLFAADKVPEFSWDAISLAFSYESADQKSIKGSSIIATMNGAQAVRD